MPKPISFSIRQKLLTGFLIPIFFFLVVALFLLVNIYRNSRLIKEIDDYTIKSTLQFMEIQKDIIHIQQWLTDISATRAENGFDEGLDKAYLYFEKARNSIDLFSIEEPEYDHGDAERLTDISSELTDFYYFGVKMAEAFISGGPALGNPLMQRFNPYAEQLHNDVEKFVVEKKHN